MVEDVKLNDFPEVDSIYKLLGLSNDGTSESIRVNELLKYTLNTRGDVIQNLDDYIDTGLYGINKDHFNTAIVGYGLLVVFNAEGTGYGGNPIVQIVFGIEGEVKYRIKWYILKWTNWRTISFTE